MLSMKPRTRRKDRSASPMVRKFLAYSLSERDRNRAIEEFFISLDTPVSLSCLILFRAGEYSQLVEKTIEPAHYNCRFKFRDDYAAVSFLRKNSFLQTSFNRKQLALEGFAKSEEQCKSTNRRFRNLAFDPQFRGSNVHLLNAMERKIAWILGDFDAEELFDSGSWGPGVTTLIKGRDVSASRKFREERGITQEAYNLFSDVLKSRLAYPHWVFNGDQDFDVQKGNRVITVPKNAKIDRTIAIEPGLNSWFQLAMGTLIRRRLARVGFNLNSDQKNQQAALQGSLDNSLATVDFSAASDTISKELVREILPARWYVVLSSLRSPCYKLGKSWSIYEKFSAMGNGFTFELESLLFVAAALAVCEYQGLTTDSVSVFGDDIIIPSEAFPLYSSFCNFLGFTVNPSKSFSDGPFRESCGAYYFEGLDVKPLFLKENVNNAKSIYRLANSIRLLAHRRNSYSGCDSKLLPVWKHLLRRIPKDISVFGPASAGDSSIHVNFDEARPRIARDQWCGFLYPGFQTIPISGDDDNESLLQVRLWRPSTDQSSGNTIGLRGVTKIRYKKSIFTPLWYNFGPWY